MSDLGVEHPTRRVVFVTGPSGAGRTTAIGALEDIGFETIDNLPLSLVERVLAPVEANKPLAIGIDTRNREFSTHHVISLLDDIKKRDHVHSELLYITCDANVLQQRFSATRRRHPLAPAETPMIGIERDFDLLAPIKARADILIDSTDLTPHDLKAEIGKWFSTEHGAALAVSVQSFSYKRGLPRGVDMMFDCRFLQNPYWDATLRHLDGRSPAVQQFVATDARYQEFVDKILAICLFLLPAYRMEGKSHFSIGLGCTGGQHRSVALAETLSKLLAKDGWQVSVRHRELERK